MIADQKKIFFKKFSLLFIVSLLFSLFSSSLLSKSFIPQELENKNFIIIDKETGCILSERGAHSKMAIGSLTQVALAITLLDWIELNHLSLNTMITISEPVAPLGKLNPFGLQAGDSLSLRDLLYLALLSSDSQAALSITTFVGAELPNPTGLDPAQNFISHMNALARALGMKHTLFLNPHGFVLNPKDPHTFSTAADLAILTRYAYSKAGLSFYVSQKSREIHLERSGKKLSFMINNTNPLLGMDHIDGVKAAHSSRSGECLILTSAHSPEVTRVENTIFTTPRRIIAVLIGGEDRLKEGKILNSFGWDCYDSWAQAGRPLKGYHFLSL